MNNEIIKELKRVLEAAGAFLLQQTVEVSSHKTANDLLTENDLQTEKFLIEEIKKILPDVNIVSEETCANTQLQGLSVVIDPIDGTCNYAVGSNRFGLQIAVFEGKKCVASFLHFPVQKETIYAVAGQGAYIGDRKLTVDPAVAPSDGMLLISDYYSNISISMDTQFEVVKRLQKNFLKTRHLGAACIDFASLVKKEAVAYICYYSYIWDIAPGLLIAREAGAVYSFIDGGAYQYGQPGLVVANNAKTLENIVKTYKEVSE